MGNRSAIILKLRAAGALTKHRRPLAEIEADIKAAMARVWELRRERKSVVLSEKAKLQHKDPIYEGKLRSARAAVYKDPERTARWLRKVQQSARESGWILPDMNREQRLAYNRMKKKGVGRDEAVKVALQ